MREDRREHAARLGARERGEDAALFVGERAAVDEEPHLVAIRRGRQQVELEQPVQMIARRRVAHTDLAGDLRDGLPRAGPHVIEDAPPRVVLEASFGADPIIQP